VVRWLALGLILRVLWTILANYPDYFPPNFGSLFLQGRESSFNGIYPTAFYLHLFSAPWVLINGLFLMSDTCRRRYGRWHRRLGRVQVLILLLLFVPSSLIMAGSAFGGWGAGLSFMLLSLTTAGCAICGTVAARRRQFPVHRRWMSRCFLLLCSAVFLRLISGAASLLELSNEEGAYIIAAWASWVVPLLVFEIAIRRDPSRRGMHREEA
jgi:uncharacterized membrane protein